MKGALFKASRLPWKSAAKNNFHNKKICPPPCNRQEIVLDHALKLKNVTTAKCYRQEMMSLKYNKRQNIYNRQENMPLKYNRGQNIYIRQERYVVQR